jgi:hypothetical protein
LPITEGDGNRIGDSLMVWPEWGWLGGGIDGLIGVTAPVITVSGKALRAVIICVYHGDIHGTGAGSLAVGKLYPKFHDLASR